MVLQAAPGHVGLSTANTYYPLRNGATAPARVLPCFILFGFCLRWGAFIRTCEGGLGLNRDL